MVMTDKGTRVVNVLSIDVEEYYHATVFQEAVNGVTAGLPSRVVSSTERILELLHAQQVKATFFVLGEVGCGSPRSGAPNRTGGARGRLPRLSPHAGVGPVSRRVPGGYPAREGRPGGRRRTAGRRLPCPHLLHRRVRALGVRDPGRGRIPLRLQHLSDSPRPLRRPRRAPVSLRDLAKRAARR